MLKINAQRLLNDLHALAQIGRTAQGGISRPAMSADDVAGRNWLRTRIESDGLRYCMDGAGNQSAVLPFNNPGARTLLVGSHIDTVPNGGAFDGALGVLAALEALRTLRAASLALPITLEAISFTDEEGSVLSMIGSLGLSGQLSATAVENTRGGATQLNEGLARIGITRESVQRAKRNPDTLAGYLELHIEQGTRLEAASVNIGVVTAIVGTRSFWLSFTGRAAHAGSTPMTHRADALLGAAAFITQSRTLVMQDFAQGVMNCGQIEAAPGAFNIVPGGVRLALEFRHPDETKLDEMHQALLALANEIATQHGLTLETYELVRHTAAQMDVRMQCAIEQSATALGLSHIRLPSFAGHDAQNMATLTPSAMIFVPSVGGISHHPSEYTHEADLINGANVLLQTLLKLAQA